jgi:hypothetical protein
MMRFSLFLLLSAILAGYGVHPWAEGLDAAWGHEVQSEPSPLASTEFPPSALADESFGTCMERRAHRHSTVYYHKFTTGGISSFEDGGPTDPESGWVSAGSRKCWGTPDDNQCHTEDEFARCDDLHSKCDGSGDLLVYAALASDEPVRAVQALLTSDAMFELSIEGRAVLVHGCSEEPSVIPIPSIPMRAIVSATGQGEPARVAKRQG